MESDSDKANKLSEVQPDDSDSKPEEEDLNSSSDILQQWLRDVDIAAIRRGAQNFPNHRHHRFKKSSSTMNLHTGDTDVSYLIDYKDVPGRASRPASRVGAKVLRESYERFLVETEAQHGNQNHNDENWIKMIQEQLSFSDLVARQAIEQVRVVCNDRGHLLLNLWNRADKANTECLHRLQRTLEANSTSARSLAISQQKVADLAKRLFNTEAERDAIRIQCEDRQRLLEEEIRQRHIANATLDDVRRRYKTDQAAFLDRLVGAEHERDELKANYGRTLVMYEDEHNLLESVIGRPLHEHVLSGNSTRTLLLWDLNDSFSVSSAFAGLKIARRTNMIVVHQYRGTYRAIFLEFNSIDEAKSSRVILSSWGRCDFASEYPSSKILISGLSESDEEWSVLEKQILCIGGMKYKRACGDNVLIEMGTPELASCVLASFNHVITLNKAHISVVYASNTVEPASLPSSQLTSQSLSSTLSLLGKVKNQGKATPKPAPVSANSALEAANTLIASLQERLEKALIELKNVSDAFGIQKAESQQRIKELTEELGRASSTITNLKQSTQKLQLQLDMKQALITENVRSPATKTDHVPKRTPANFINKGEDLRPTSNNIEVTEDLSPKGSSQIVHYTKEDTFIESKPDKERQFRSSDRQHSDTERPKTDIVQEQRKSVKHTVIPPTSETIHQGLFSEDIRSNNEPQDYASSQNKNDVEGTQTLPMYSELEASYNVETDDQDALNQQHLASNGSLNPKKHKKMSKKKHDPVKSAHEAAQMRTIKEIPDLRRNLPKPTEINDDRDTEIGFESVKGGYGLPVQRNDDSFSETSPDYVSKKVEAERHASVFGMNKAGQSILGQPASQASINTFKPTRSSESRALSGLNQIGIRSDDESNLDSGDRSQKRDADQPTKVNMKKKLKSGNKRGKTKSKKGIDYSINGDDVAVDDAQNSEPACSNGSSEVRVSETKSHQNQGDQLVSMPHPELQDDPKPVRVKRKPTKSAKNRHDWVQKMLTEEHERIANDNNQLASGSYLSASVTAVPGDINGEWSDDSDSESELSQSDIDNRHHNPELSDNEQSNRRSPRMNSGSSIVETSQAQYNFHEKCSPDNDFQSKSVSVAGGLATGKKSKNSVIGQHKYTRKNDLIDESLSEGETPSENNLKTHLENEHLTTIMRHDDESDNDSDSSFDSKRKPRRHRVILPPGIVQNQLSTRAFHKRSLLRRINHIYQSKLDVDIRRKRCALPILSLNEFIIQQYIPVNFGIDILVQSICQDLYMAVTRFSRHLPEVALFKMFYDNAFADDTVALVTLYIHHRESALSSPIWNVTPEDMLDLYRLGETRYIRQNHFLSALGSFFPVFSHYGLALLEQEMQALATLENVIGMHSFFKFCIQKQHSLNIKFRNTAHRIFAHMGLNREPPSNIFWHRPLLIKILVIMFRSATLKQVEQAVADALSDPISLSKFISALTPLSKCCSDPEFPIIYQSVSAPTSTLSPQCLSLSKVVSDHWSWFKSSPLGFDQISTIFQQYNGLAPISVQVALLQDYADLIDSLIQANFSIEALITYKKILMQIHLVEDTISYYHQQQPSYDAVGRELSHLENNLLNRLQNEHWSRFPTTEGELSTMEPEKAPYNSRSFVEFDPGGCTADRVIVKLQRSISNKSIPLKPQTFDGTGVFWADSSRYNCPHASLQPHHIESRSKQLYTNGIRMFNMAAYHEMRRSMSTDNIKHDRIKLAPIFGSKQL